MDTFDGSACKLVPLAPSCGCDLAWKRQAMSSHTGVWCQNVHCLAGNCSVSCGRTALCLVGSVVRSNAGVVCVCLICSWWCVDLVLFRMPRIIRSHAAAPRGHDCTQTTKKKEGVLMIAIISTFEHGDCYQKQIPKQRLLSETKSEAKLEQWTKLGT